MRHEYRWLSYFHHGLLRRLILLLNDIAASVMLANRGNFPALDGLWLVVSRSTWLKLVCTLPNGQIFVNPANFSLSTWLMTK